MSKFHPVVELPATYDVFDFTTGYDPQRLRGLYGVGKYNEKRSGMYTAEMYASGPVRDIHVGVDLAAPVGSKVFAFDDGSIYMVGINPAAGDYGGTLITEHVLDGRPIWALHGHLSHASLELHAVGSRVKRGEVIAFVGDEKENGGWNPHVHFQLSWLKPVVCDMPGVVNEKDREQALRDYPDPRLVLGPLYPDAFA